MVKIIGFILSLCLASCSLMALQEPEVSISDVKVIAIASGDEAEFCRGFTLTRAQVESYFERAEEVSFSDLHDEFDYLPCAVKGAMRRSEEHTSELQSRGHLVCRLLLEKKKRCAVKRMRGAVLMGSLVE